MDNLFDIELYKGLYNYNSLTNYITNKIKRFKLQNFNERYLILFKSEKTSVLLEITTHNMPPIKNSGIIRFETDVNNDYTLSTKIIYLVGLLMCVLDGEITTYELHNLF